MGKPPRLDELDTIIGKKEDVFLTDREYSERTGVNLPKGKSYLMRHSAFSTWLSERGYVIVDVQEEPVIERTVHIRKK